MGLAKIVIKKCWKKIGSYMPITKRERSLSRGIRRECNIRDKGMASGAGTTLKEESVALVPDLSKFK